MAVVSASNCNERSILDWPLPTHTSPTCTSSRVMVPEAAEMIRGAGPLASIGGNSICHVPSAAAHLETTHPLYVTVTCSLALAVPQTGTGRWRWSTAWSLKGLATVRAAVAGVVRAPTSSKLTKGMIKAYMEPPSCTGMSCRTLPRAETACLEVFHEPGDKGF